VHIYRVATPGKVQTALHLASINDADFKVYKESNSSTLRYECIDPIQTLEVYDLKGSKIKSITNTELQGSIELNNQYKGTILIIKASTKNNTYVRKSVLN